MPGLGIHPVVYCDRKHTAPDFSIPGVDLVRLPALAGKHLRMTSLDLLSALHAVGAGRCDLAHLHNVEASFVLPLLRLRYPVVATSHGSAYWRAKWGPLARRLIRAMDWPFATWSTVATAVSEKDARDLGARFGREVAYIPNGVGVEYQPDKERARALLEVHGLADQGYFVFVAGRIEPTKGAHLAIEAVNRLSPGVPLLVVGDDLQVPAYGRALREAAGPQFRFQPLVEDPAVLFGLMAGARALVFPSLVEAMSMVLLEGAALGLPIVCSDLPENRAVLGDAALYFESGNSDSLRRELERALDEPQRLSVMSAKARERALSDFSWDAITSRYVQIYRQVLLDEVAARSRGAAKRDA